MQILHAALVYDADCPSADAARVNLRAALEAAGLPATWREVCRSTAGPEGLRSGSPTIMVNGIDAVPAPLAAGRTCRTYLDANGELARAPSVDAILAAVRAATCL